jgi:hypothetical protein
MGVSAYFYAYDEIWFRDNYREAVTIDMLEKTQILSTEDGDVAPQFAHRICEIDTYMGNNKQWNNNLSCESVYSHIRTSLPADIQHHCDDLFNLLFWDVDFTTPDRPARIVPPYCDHESDCRLYSATTVDYIAAIAFGQESLRPYAQEFIANWPNADRSDADVPDFELEQLRPFFDRAVADWPSAERSSLNLRDNDCFDTFLNWVDEWLMIFGKVAILGGGRPWALTIYISY